MEKVIWFNLRQEVENLKESALSPASAVLTIPASTNLPAVPASFADLAAARAAVEAQRAAVEARLDTLESKVNEVISKLTTSGIIL
jgi:hypothetical protein